MTPNLISLSLILTVALFLSGCTPLSTTDSTPPTNIDKTTTNNQFVPTYPINNLNLQENTVLKLKLTTNNQQLIAESEPYIFSKDKVIVADTGEAYIKFEFSKTDSNNIDQTNLTKILYEITPDSLGNTSDIELDRIVLNSN